jgi:hypothetical protein
VADPAGSARRTRIRAAMQDFIGGVLKKELSQKWSAGDLARVGSSQRTSAGVARQACVTE